MSARAVLGAAILGGLACSERPATQAPAQSSAGATAVPADSLVARASDGAEIWFTLARADSGSTGECTARAIEIRRGERRIPVPLLYAVSLPEIVDDTTMRARLSDDCAPGDSYLVDLRTGRPVRER